LVKIFHKTKFWFCRIVFLAEIKKHLCDLVVESNLLAD
jgi:hypothetical protein